MPGDGSTHWSTRTLGLRVGIGRDAVAKIWADHGLKPWKVDTFKVSNDPRFEEKLVDVVGLYLNPPARAVVFSYDEKTSCQALDRTQPSLPMKAGRAGRAGRAGTMTHDYKRHGTIDLFAAMNVATGEVLTDLRKGHAGADVLRFFKQIDAAVPRAALPQVSAAVRDAVADRVGTLVGMHVDAVDVTAAKVVHAQPRQTRRVQ